ncbi:hypothetical protein [Nonomuraea sp. NPDC049309]|jgi:hypothetical protein|uniref:hypothetical protein n=1 Tax=Nonomuraea sp. NPDC049309 TaxID=3364350 RepID=UPI00370F9DA8
MSRRVLVSVAAGVLVAALGVAGWLWFTAETPRPSALHAEATSAFYAAIDSRQNDAAPLTPDEVFPASSETLGTLRRVAADAFTDCSELLVGASAEGCTQALRATYQGGSVSGQFVIFNLGDGKAADALVAELRKDAFVRQDIPFDVKGSSAQVRAMGHYVTVSWVGGKASAQDLVTALVALDGLGRVVQDRIVAAT